MTFQKGNKFGRGAAAQHPNNILSQALISQLNELDKNDPRNRPKFAQIVDKMIALAIAGDKDMIIEIFDRVQGKARQAVEVSGTDGDALRIERIEHVIIRAEGSRSLEDLRVVNGNGTAVRDR